MKALDTTRYAANAVSRSPTRSALMLLAVSIGVAAVLLLTGLGEAARRYVSDEFVSLGTNLVIVMPGRSDTTSGMMGAGFGGTTRDLTIADAHSLTRHQDINKVAPLVVGTADIQRGSLERESVVYGTSNELLSIRKWAMASGQFLPVQDWNKALQVVVIGNLLQDELFAGKSALGQWLRVGDSRFRVIGVLATQGRSMGMDVESAVLVPVASAMSMFNTESLFRILIESQSTQTMRSVKQHALDTIQERHRGEQDVTVITQDAVLQTFDQIFNALTMTIGGIGAISLAVAGILIMNVMLVSVAQRTSEVGLLKAIGASPIQIKNIFLLEAALLSLSGALIGLVIGFGGAKLIGWLYPVLNMTPPIWAIVAGVGMALGTGLLFGLLPAKRAAALDPVASLTGR